MTVTVVCNALFKFYVLSALYLFIFLVGGVAGITCDIYKREISELGRAMGGIDTYVCILCAMYQRVKVIS